MKKNGSILGFFKPVSQSSQSSRTTTPSQPELQRPSETQQEQEPESQAQTPPKTQAQLKAQTPTTAAKSTFDPLSIISSPFGPASSQPSSAAPTPQKPLSRDAEIKGSDDEDEDSDCSMEDLSTIIRRAQPGFSPAKPANPCVTPKSKRIATYDFHSPMTIRSVKHKFDMKALQSHAEADNAREAAAKKVEDLFAKDEEIFAAKAKKADTERPTSGDGPKSSPTEDKQEQFIARIAADEDEDLDKDRLARAIRGTNLVAAPEQWYFFQANPSKPTRAQFPREKANGRWRFLKDQKTRREYLADGLAQQILQKKNDLPDEIFLWMLDEICVDEDDTLRTRYTDLLSVASDQVQQFVNPERLCGLFQSLGSRYESTDLSESLETSSSVIDQYAGRDWSRLRSLLKTLSRIAPSMDLEAKICAVQLLLRLGLDTLVIENVDIFVDYQDAFQALTSAVPISSWERFCEEVCSSLYLKVEQQSLRRQALACIPSSSPKPHELRRRLAAIFLFDDLARARQSPDTSFSIHSVLTRLDAPEFQVKPKTDYHDLAAMVWFVDIFIDDASRDSYRSREAQDEFNADVDKLVVRLKHIWRTIGVASLQHVAKLESKAVLECVQNRLTHSVRTKRPQKQKLFDTEKKEDKSLPKQRALMQSFFQKKPQAASVAAAVS